MLAGLAVTVADWVSPGGGGGGGVVWMALFCSCLLMLLWMFFA